MGLRPGSQSPDCTIKSYIDTSYDNVKTVSDNIDDVNKLASEIDTIKYGAISFVQEEVPSVEGITQGARWYKPSEPTMYIYYINEGETTGSWVEDNSVGDDVSLDTIEVDGGVSLRDYLDSLDSLNGALDTRVGTLETDVTNLTGRVSVNETKLTSIETGAQVNTVKTVSGKTGNVTLDGSDINVTGGTLQTKLNSIDSAVDEVKESLTLKVFQSPTDNLTKVTTYAGSVGTVYEVRKTSDNSLATIYSNAAGTVEIVQNGTDNKSGSDGVVEFYIESSFEELKIESGPASARFKNREFIDANVKNIIYKPSSGASAVDNMVAGAPFKARIGDLCCSGSTKWERVSDTGETIADFKPIGAVDVADFNAGQADAALFINEAINLGYDVKTSLKSCNTSTSIGVVSTAGDIDFSGMVITSTAQFPFVVGSVGSNPYKGTITRPTVKSTNARDDGDAFIFQNFTGVIDNPRQENYGTGYSLKPHSSSRVAYALFVNLKSVNHKRGIVIQPADATSYANENTFQSCRLGPFTAGRLEYQIDIDNQSGSGAQHNKFISGSIEGYSGGGACGISAVRCRNQSNSNTFMFMRAEQYNDGWSSGFAYELSSGVACENNHVETKYFLQLISDSSGRNTWNTPTQGVRGRNHPTNTDQNMIKHTRPDAVTNSFALDLADTYTPSGSVKGIRHSTPRSQSGAGSSLELETGYGVIHRVSDTGTIEPRDNFADIGGGSKRFRDLYLVNAPTVGSDYRLKDDIKSIPQELLDFAMSVEIQQYKLKNSESGRNHYGIVITEAFLDNLSKITDLDLCAAFCHSVFKDEEGNPVTKKIGDIETGELWMVRYTEWQNILIEAMRRKLNSL